MEEFKIFDPGKPIKPEIFFEGLVLLIDKPLTWSSFDVVNKIRILLRKHLDIKKIKVGHAGTLDPLATGLLLICTGKATPKINKLTELDKEYIAKISFGATTPSYDLETEMNEYFDTKHINYSLIEDSLSDFIGKQFQTPPVYSAIWVDGKRAYEQARKGKKPQILKREIEIEKIELLDYTPPVATIRILCSKGTYVRTLAYDLGKALKSGAHLSGLERTAIGTFKVEDAIDLEEFGVLLKGSEKDLSFQAK